MIENLSDNTKIIVNQFGPGLPRHHELILKKFSLICILKILIIPELILNEDEKKYPIAASVVDA